MTLRRFEPTVVAGRYRVLEPLGHGGMGDVYLVEEVSTGARIALKRMRGKAAEADPVMFRHEFHSLAQLDHPSIVRAYEYGLDHAAPYYTMEYVEGTDLRELAALPWRKACIMLRDIAAVLAFLHSRRLIHRDLTLRNVRRTPNGVIKLIDFGALATPGVQGEIIGTPPFIAPETAHGAPLDHRADLFALGAVAHWVLTGHHAYPGRSLLEVTQRWSEGVPSIRTSIPELPAALDDLVMSMLQPDPRSRPGSAAEVMERLAAVAELDALAQSGERGYLASTVLVGRRQEMARMRQMLRHALSGEARSIMVRGPSGMGKTRLLRELVLQAQLEGAAVVQTEAGHAERAAFGTLRGLTRELLRRAPTEATDAARARGPLLVRALPELGGRLRGVAPAPLVGDPGEDRLRLQSALVSWLLEIAKRRPLVLLVDDVQWSDEGSAAVLASVAHESSSQRLLLVTALRTDVEIRNAGALAALNDAGASLQLGGLSAEDTEDLVRSLFGDLPETARIAAAIHAAAEGTPLHCHELARQLVDRGLVRYTAGSWVVSEDLGRLPLSPNVAAAMDSRISQLGEESRRLGEALAVQGGELPLDLCIRLADAPDEQRVFAALDALVYEEVLLGAGHVFRFRHSGLREALLRGLDDARFRLLHRRAARCFEDGEGRIHPDRELEVGWHLLRGGLPSRAAELLLRAGRRLYETQSFRDAVGPLEAALETLDERVAAKDCVEARYMLVTAGLMCERQLAIRHGPPLIDRLQRFSGMDTAARVSPRVGRPAAVIAGLGAAALRRLRGPGPRPLQALFMYQFAIGQLIGVHTMSWNFDPVPALERMAEPLAIFRRRLTWGAHLILRSLRRLALGQWPAMRRDVAAFLDILERDGLTPLTTMQRRILQGGARYMLAQASAIDQRADFEAQACELEAQELRTFKLSACVTRLHYHRLRGEEQRALELEALAQRMMVQLGGAWASQSQLVLFSALAYGLTRDVVGLHRSVERLAQLVDAGFGFQGSLELARAEYAREQSQLDYARRSAERALAVLPGDDRLVRPVALAALAEILLATGDHDGARDQARRSIELCRGPDVDREVVALRAERAFALAGAAAGNLTEAAGRLERALDESRRIDNPIETGGLHEARARVARLAGDFHAVSAHAQLARHHYARTDNTLLLARADRLIEPVAAPLSRRASADVTADIREQVTMVLEAPDYEGVLRSCRGASERFHRALELLVEAAQAARGYLYVAGPGDELELVAPLDASLTALAGAWPTERRPLGAADDFTAVDTPAEADASSEHRVHRIPLRFEEGGRTVEVGVVAVIEGALPLTRPPAQLVAAVARDLASETTRSFRLES